MANTFVRLAGGWFTVGLIRTPAPGGPVEVPPPTPDRPALTSPPNASTTGPRIALTASTLSGAEAVAAAIANGGKLVGRSILGPIQLTQPAHGNLVFQDCEINGGGYCVGCWQSPSQGHTRPTDGSRAVFDHCRMIGSASSGAGTSACVIGYDHILLHCDLSRGTDCYKAYGGNEMYGCYLHDTWHWDGAHCDTIQVQNGSDFLIHWNNIQAFNHPSSPTNAGLPASGGLQTGTVLGGGVTNFRMNDNWVDGGGYTLRGPGGSNNPNNQPIDMKWRRNKHGRGFNLGPIAHMTATGSDYDSSNIYIDNGQPVTGS